MSAAMRAGDAAAQCPPQWIKLCVLICPLYKLIQDLICKEQLKYSKGVMRIEGGLACHRSRNPQPAEVRMRAAARASGDVVWLSELME
jgi:hypothetical protein